MSIMKKIEFSPSPFLNSEDGKKLCKEARMERWGSIPDKVQSHPGDNDNCQGCPIWIRWACTKCDVCMYWLEDTE